MTGINAPQFNGKAHTKMQALAKPIGAVCNIDCTYCYYLDKKELLNYSTSESKVMSDEQLETYVRQYIEAQNTPEIIFSWHGGEPTLLGVDYFKQVVLLQKKYCPEYSSITNDIQTNATLLDDEWCRFFKQHDFVVGVSIDGPEAVHNRYRTNKAGRGTFKQTMKGIELLKKHQVTFATLSCVNDVSVEHPLEVYRFLRDVIAPSQMQFIPVVDKIDAPINGKWHTYGDMSIIPVSTNLVSDWSVKAEQWGQFLMAIFDEWLANDFGKVFIPYFDNFFAVWSGQQSTMCTLSEICGKGLAVEPNGDVYSCDHYVYEEFKLGNFNQQSLKQLAFSQRQQTFGFAKQKSLPNQCLECDYKFACHGECPKNRIIQSVDGEDGLNYLCSGWLRFFSHIDPILTRILVRNNIQLGER
ncbi:anaerobic sulfatase maturase [Vibrio superstes]|uniref:Anaerobic sulfatase maturase n=1 Tax=Vibrio superstes NBRC 103154 TaxID=1219062 RepID=A0A511QVV2_9VIBR|nr:anaerobic sulfatase maturase [Vibrio superstes]GEM81503.1 anaerobic sulfatase maturase [Vibrio superstes NBRC 103154]